MNKHDQRGKQRHDGVVLGTDAVQIRRSRVQKHERQHVQTQQLRQRLVERDGADLVVFDAHRQCHCHSPFPVRSCGGGLRR